MRRGVQVVPLGISTGWQGDLYLAEDAVVGVGFIKQNTIGEFDPAREGLPLGVGLVLLKYQHGIGFCALASPKNHKNIPALLESRDAGLLQSVHHGNHGALASGRAQEGIH